MEKVTVTKEVAEAIEEFLTDCTGGRTNEEMRGVLVAEHCGQDWRRYEDGQYSELNNISTFELMRALVNGYTIEKSPEEKLRNIFEEYRANYRCTEDWERDNAYAEGVLFGIEETLELLDITIEGIND